MAIPDGYFCLKLGLLMLVLEVYVLELTLELGAGSWMPDVNVGSLILSKFCLFSEYSRYKIFSYFFILLTLQVCLHHPWSLKIPELILGNQVEFIFQLASLLDQDGSSQEFRCN